MTVQLQISGAQRALDATASLTVTDPAGQVAAVQFMVSLIGGAPTGPYAADRAAGGVFEKDVPLDPQRLVRVLPVVMLTDGSQQKAPSAVFGVANEPVGVAPGALASVTVTPGSGLLTVASAIGTATRWRCYARLGHRPTDDDSDRGALTRQYLRFEGDGSTPSFTMRAQPGNWFCTVLGYNAAGQAGPRTLRTVQVPS